MSKYKWYDYLFATIVTIAFASTANWSEPWSAAFCAFLLFGWMLMLTKLRVSFK